MIYNIASVEVLMFGPYNLTGSGTVRKCSFVGVAMAFIEEVRHCGADFGISYVQNTT